MLAELAAANAAFARFTGTWELKASKENAHSSLSYSVDFSPDGKSIVSGSADKAIKVWDAGMAHEILLKKSVC